MKIKFNNGFTIIELMIGIVAAAVLALTAGTMLANVYSGWVRSLALVDMERDAAVTIHSLDLAVRGAADVDLGGSTLKAYWPNNSTNVFSISGNSLLYNGMTCVDKRLESFSVTRTGSMVRVSMSLTNQNVRMGFTNMCIRMRNVP